MPSRKRTASAFEASRLAVLAAGGDDDAFAAYATELLASGDRLAREAAVAALVEHPAAEARRAMIALFDELSAGGLKADQGAGMRTGIMRYLRRVGDTRDEAIALRACATSENAFGHDSARLLRAEGLKWLAEWSPDLFPFIAAEHLDDAPDEGLGDDEPANTAFQLLANGEDYLALYQWLMSHPGSSRVPVVFALLTGAPPAIVRRFVERAVADAIAAEDEPLCTLLAESIVEREIESAYPALASMLAARKVSRELYTYIAVLMAGTNRAPLLAILEQELHNGRQREAVVAALRIRTTPEQEAILKRWDER